MDECRLKNAPLWDEHPCASCKYQNKIECPYSLKGMLFNVMKKWYGTTGKEEKHKNAQKYSEKSLESFINSYSKGMNPRRRVNR